MPITSRPWTKPARIAVLLGCASLTHFVAAQAAPYTVHLLPPVDYSYGNSSYSAAYAINNSGLVVGAASTNDRSFGPRAVRWAFGDAAPVQLNGLSTIPSENVSKAYSVNDQGVVGGFAQVPSTSIEAPAPHAVRWSASGTSAQELATLGTSGAAWQLRTGEAAYGIDQAGNALGFSARFLDDGRLRGTGAVRWGPDGSAAVYATLGSSATGYTDGTTFDFIYAANATGWAVGSSNLHPARWSPGGATVEQLDDFGGLGDNTAPLAINIHGDAVGKAYKSASGAVVAALWPAGGTSILELPTPGSYDSAVAYAINATGEIVGSASVLSGAGVNRHAFIWKPGETAPTDLNSLIDPSSGWILTEARGINDAGMIVGSGMYDPDGAGPLPTLNLAFRLDPVPEPGAIWTLGLAATATCLRRRAPSRQ